MVNSAETRSTWTLGIKFGQISGLPLFVWGRGEWQKEKSPVSFCSETGEFLLRLPRQNDYGTKNVLELVKRLVDNGLSEPPELRKVQEVFERFANSLPSLDQKTYEQIETEWRKLLANPNK